MDEEQLKILEMVANKTITPEEAAKLLEALQQNSKSSGENDNTETNSIFATEELEYNNEEQMDVTLELGITNFKLYKGEDNKLYKIEYTKTEGLQHKINYNHNELQIRNDIKASGFDINSLRKFVDPNSKKCSIGLNKNVKLYMKVKFGGGKADLDFSDLKIKRLRLSSGASDTRIIFNKTNAEELDYLKVESGASNIDVHGLGNANCTDMDFSLGACNAILDFSGDIKKDLYADISMRVGRLSLLIPKDTGVKIKTSERLVNINLPNFSSREGYKVSENIDSATRIINLKIDSTLAQVNLSWV